MSRIDLLHPAPIRFVPRRGRSVHVRYEALTTPAELHDVSPSEMRPTGCHVTSWNGNRTPVHEHGGRIWTPFVGGEGMRPTLAGFLREFLETGGVLIGPTGRMPAPLLGTPLHVMTLRDEPAPNRGEPFDPLRVGRFVEDGRDAARDAAAAFVASDLRTCDGTAFVRLRGPMAHWMDPGGDTPANGGYRLCLHPVAYAARSFALDALVRADAIDRHAAFRADAIERRAPPMAPDRPPSPTLVGYDGDPANLACGDDDLDIACNRGLVATLILVGRAMAKAGAAMQDPGAVLEACGRLDSHAARASVAGVTMSGRAEVLHGMDDLLRAFLARCPEGVPMRDAVERQAAWLSADLLPRAIGPMPEADADALTGLSP